MRVLALAAVLLFVAGCVGPSTSSSNGPSGPVPAPSKDPAWAVKAIFAGEDPLDNDRAPQHDHTNRTLHKGLSTPNFQVLGHNGIVSGYFEQPAGTYYCGDVSSGPRQIAVVHSFQTDVAIEVLDVTNRSDVKVLGELVLPYVFTYDAAIFSDASYAVIAGNPDLASDKPPIAALREQAEKTGKVPFQPMWRTQCGTFALKSNVDSIPYGYSAILVDLKDPTNPTVASFYEYPGGRNVHSISTAIIDGTHYVVTSGLMAIPCTLPGVTGNPVANPIPCEPQVPRFGNLLSHFDFLTVTDLGGVRAQLTPYLVYTPTDQTHLDPSLLYLSNGHTDATLEKHPVTGQLIAYLADWDGGLHIIRLDGPQQATALADWGQAPGGDPTQMKGHIHSAYPVPGLRDGKHYVVVGQEVVGRPAGRSSGQIDILDVTNPSVVIRGAKWTLPIDVQWPPSQGEMFSTHYPILVNDTLYVSLYHGGVWAADAGKKNWPDLPSIGVFVPDADPAGGVFHGGPTPEVLEVLSLGDGNILVFDGTTGAYTVHFSGPDARVPPVAPWPDNDWIG